MFSIRFDWASIILIIKLINNNNFVIHRLVFFRSVSGSIKNNYYLSKIRNISKFEREREYHFYLYRFELFI